MKAHHAAGPAIWVAVMSAGLGLTTGCGASFQAIYEGDVRFERCMSLDVQPRVAPAQRRDCWTNWVAFYTYGQTRDRVLHAQLRIKQLGGETVRLPAGGAESETSGAPATALRPALTSGDERIDEPLVRDAADTAIVAPRDPSTRCITDCQATHEQCGRSCNDADCLAVCSRAHDSCTRSCS